jgi:excinuclease ABC subunit C
MSDDMNDNTTPPEHDLPDQDNVTETPFERGRQVILDAIKNLPVTPGVYRMINAKKDILYVGKAKQLPKRVLSYTQQNRLPLRLQRMVAETVSMEFIHTHTEAEALLLEANMIRKHMPRYNILLRDDKSVPYIFLSGDHDYPQLSTHRGARTRTGDYFGPFASAEPVYQTIATLQRAFMLRNCSDHDFATRARPCLQYHIKRCTAPCVGRVTKEQYADQVKQAKLFLSGKSHVVQETMAVKMQQASEDMDYETAMQYRDRIRALTAVQAKQGINLEGIIDDVDVIAAVMKGGQACIQVFFFRFGRNYGNKAYFPRHDKDVTLPEVLASFIGQFYQSRPAAPEVLLSEEVIDQDILAEALTTENNHKVSLVVPQRGAKKRLIDQAVSNAAQAHARHMAQVDRHQDLLEKLAELMGLGKMPERVEIYDNSHLSGKQALGVMVVVGPEGFERKQYRRFNIKGEIVEGDDYAMLREVLTRRLSRGLKERAGEEDTDVAAEGTPVWPDVLVIDGGKGQLSTTLEVLADLKITDVPVMAISKGPDRNAGREIIHMPHQDPIQLESNDPLLYFLQRIRDEAHRFAITGQRASRTKNLTKSSLDSIPGIGGKRKKSLLMHFGSAKGVADAGVEDLMAVTGISQAMAQQIYDFYHPDR